MTTIAFNCPHCSQPFETDASRAGAHGRCPKCKGSVVVPDIQPTEPILVVDPVPEPPAPQTIGSCPYCRGEMLSSDNLRACPTCETPHHRECWNENKGCTVFGCSMAPPEEEKVSVEVPAGGGMNLQPAAAMAGSAGVAALPYPLGEQANAEGAMSSLVFGILGLFICGPIFGLAAISNANKAKKAIKANPELYTGDGLATAGLVMGIIDLALWALVILGSLAAP